MSGIDVAIILGIFVLVFGLGSWIYDVGKEAASLEEIERLETRYKTIESSIRGIQDRENRERSLKKIFEFDGRYYWEIKATPANYKGSGGLVPEPLAATISRWQKVGTEWPTNFECDSLDQYGWVVVKSAKFRQRQQAVDWIVATARQMKLADCGFSDANEGYIG